MSLHFPAFNHSLVEDPAADGSDEKHGESDASDATNEAEECEVDHSGDGGAEVGGKAGVVPKEEAKARVEEDDVEVGEGDVGVEEEAEEMWESLEGDAVGGPGTVVVHFGDAGAAVAAVVGAEGFRGCAFLAPASGEGLVDG